MVGNHPHAHVVLAVCAVGFSGHFFDFVDDGAHLVDLKHVGFVLEDKRQPL